MKRKSKTALIDQTFSELAGQVALWNHVWPFESSFLALSMMYHSIPRKFRLDRPGPSDDDDDDDDGTSSHISAPVWGRSFPHWRRPQHLDCKFVSLEISNQNIGPSCLFIALNYSVRKNDIILHILPSPVSHDLHALSLLFSLFFISLPHQKLGLDTYICTMAIMLMRGKNEIQTNPIAPTFSHRLKCLVRMECVVT